VGIGLADRSMPLLARSDCSKPFGVDSNALLR
jgi:hypothetical protein